jgi:hypothetical protein
MPARGATTRMRERATTWMREQVRRLGCARERRLGCSSQSALCGTGDGTAAMTRQRSRCRRKQLRRGTRHAVTAPAAAAERPMTFLHLRRRAHCLPSALMAAEPSERGGGGEDRESARTVCLVMAAEPGRRSLGCARESGDSDARRGLHCAARATARHGRRQRHGAAAATRQRPSRWRRRRSTRQRTVP